MRRLERWRRHRGRAGEILRQSLPAAVILAVLAACTVKSDPEFRAEIAASMHKSINNDLVSLVQAAHDLQAIAPSRAWDPVGDAGAIERMRDAWKRMRVAWENIEGAMAPMFPGLNISLDARYEDFLVGLGSAGDPNPFDDEGVVGMHAVERILFAPTIRPAIVTRESRLDGYRPAAYPATDIEAIAFKTQLLQRMIDDTTTMKADWRPDDIDVGAAYQGLVDLMLEQRDKVNLAVRAEEESRYANVTLLDLRNNVSGTQTSYEQFREWIQSKATAGSSDQQIVVRLTQLMEIYEAYRSTDGDSLPKVPDGWSSDGPTPESLNTPFGALWLQIHESVDPASNGSVVYEMNRIADLLGFPAVVE